MIIGIVGPIASGKNVLSDILVERGFIRLSFSEEVRKEANLRRIPIERKYLQDLGNLMREKYGSGYWAERVVTQIEEGKNYVVEGIRNPGEVNILRRLQGFVFIGIDAPLEKRYQWIVERNKDSDPKSLEKISEMDARDRGVGEGSHGQQVDVCYRMADRYIMNDGTKDDLKKKVEDLLGDLNIIKRQ